MSHSAASYFLLIRISLNLFVDLRVFLIESIYRRIKLNFDEFDAMLFGEEQSVSWE